MTMSDLASYAPSAYDFFNRIDLLNRMGLERRRSRAAQAAACAGWISLGVAMGSGFFMLMNSRNGPIVRERLAERVRRAREYVAPSEESEPRTAAGSETRSAARRA
jgi:hypothetical protein